jgi:5-methylcytosine-specific restriction endonuclease McrA
MRPHVKNYLKAFGYDEADTILCEKCGTKAVDIHHIEFRSRFGRKRNAERDAPENLVALCRTCHEAAHTNTADFKQILLDIAQTRKSRR